MFVAMAVGFAMGVVAERTLIRPVRRRNETAVLIVALGLFTALNGLDGWIWGSRQQDLFPRLFPSDPEKDYILVGGAQLHYDTMSIIAVMIVVVVLLTLLFNPHQARPADRAVATNAETAALSGIRVGRVLSIKWGLWWRVGSLAGVLLVPVLPPNQLDLSSFFSILIFASAAALFGGLDSAKGAVVGGLGLASPSRCSTATPPSSAARCS